MVKEQVAVVVPLPAVGAGTGGSCGRRARTGKVAPRQAVPSRQVAVAAGPRGDDPLAECDASAITLTNGAASMSARQDAPLALTADDSGCTAGERVTDEAGGLAALLPLTAGGRLVGAVCVVRSHPGGAQESFSPEGCPSLFSSPSALSRLALYLSLALLGGGGEEHLAGLRECVRALEEAESMQQLLEGVCDGVTQHVRRIFLLDPWVVPALVPEHSASVALMFSWEGAAVGFPQSTPKQSSRTLQPPLSPANHHMRWKADLYDTGSSYYGLLDTGDGPMSFPTLCDGALVEDGATVALRAEPFTLQQTMLRELVQGAPQVGSTRLPVQPEGVAVAVGGKSSSGGGPQPASELQHPVAAEVVEDCAARLQDPAKPARDILLLRANGMKARNDGGSGAPATGGGGSSARGHRGVGSLLLLALPTGCRRGALCLYVTFPHQLPRPLLQQAQASVMELLQVLCPLVPRKLGGELSLELETLATAAPGSYAVPRLIRSVFSERPGDRAAVAAWAAAGLISSGPAASYGRDGYASHSLLPTMEHLGCVGALQRSAGNTASVIHVEELTPAQSGFGSQLPLLVASLQDSISGARLRTAAVTAAAASAARSPSFRARSGGPSPSSLHSPRTAAGGLEIAAAASSGGNGGSVGDSSRGTGSGLATAGRTPDAMSSICDGALTDLAQLRLGRRLGHGGCAVVFKARLGTQDCAVKLMDLPEDGRVSLELVSHTTPISATTRARAAERQVAARRALLRNAMELAATTGISHPNIMQVYTTFSPVALGVEQRPDGSEAIALKPADCTEGGRGPDAPPVCIAIVCEWCDRGSLAGALADKALTRLVPASAVSGAQAKEGQREVRVLDVRAILLTLLDVALALRHLHSLNLIHRDLKPANVLLKTCPTDPRGFTAKLADFGFVTLLNQSGDEEDGFGPYALVDEFAGTITHTAPEAVECPARLGASCDVYSEMTVCGVRPFPQVELDDILGRVKAGHRPAFHGAVPLPYRSLAQRCWSADPKQRPRSPELVVALNGLLRSMTKELDG
ncbi:hypothetical protein GPECTOR_3g342 [Gonium pectorale]|uniref:Protein kinase domain-containing protein n=1 Tax=Gonium pectorale TaxID=33097 RepID=A0A150H000_GONPE|nr:hypothetical protein GPECTOR_3g342 [Gonium pectorale]|eukprot:KXZ55198.1 hypothetical protein GPECTOR_3g342 [Gonium pectorale]